MPSAHCTTCAASPMRAPPEHEAPLDTLPRRGATFFEFGTHGGALFAPSAPGDEPCRPLCPGNTREHARLPRETRAPCVPNSHFRRSCAALLSSRRPARPTSLPPAASRDTFPMRGGSPARFATQKQGTPPLSPRHAPCATGVCPGHAKPLPRSRRKCRASDVSNLPALPPDIGKVSAGVARLAPSATQATNPGRGCSPQMTHAPPSAIPPPKGSGTSRRRPPGPAFPSQAKRL